MQTIRYIMSGAAGLLLLNSCVKDNSIFVLDFKGSLSERVQENPLQQLLGEEFEAYGLDDCL